MARFAFIATLVIIVVVAFLGITFMKDSYKILPINASKEFTPAPYADWRDFSAPGGKFHVMFPALPQHATQTVKDQKTQQNRHYDMYVAEKEDGTIYMISLIRFQEGKEASETLQKTVVNDLLAANPTNQLKNMKIGSYRTFKTLDFTIANSEMTIEGMTFVDGPTLYLLTTVFRNAFYKPDDFQYFIHSFELGSASAEPKS